MKTRKLSKTFGCSGVADVVQSQLCFGSLASLSSATPSDTYDVIRFRSAYCATSSGIIMYRFRASTHPALPSVMRTRYQSSPATFGAGAPLVDASNVVIRGTDRATQSEGGFGAGGIGGGGICSSAFGFSS